MKIRTIRVEGFKKFRDPFTLADLTDGINLIAAPNGSGKSTIAEAVRVGFQERHRTASLGELLAPWTQPGASPSVQIEFMYDGKRHRVAKTFGGKKSCTVDVDGKSMTGDDAEQMLSNMFSFSYASKGVSRPEHQGVPGLLWVRQGSAGEIATQVTGAHDYISRALGNDMGELAATAGDRVIEQVETELAVLQTKGGKPTGDFAKAIEQATASRQELTRLEAGITEYDAAVDRFAGLQKQHAEGERDRPWERHRAQAELAAQGLRSIEQLANQREQLELQRRLAAGRVAQCTEQLAVFDLEGKAVQDRTSELETARKRDGETLQQVRSAEGLLQSAQQADTAAREAAGAARRAATRKAHEEARDAAQQRLEELRQQIAAVEGHQAQLSAHEGARARLAGFAGLGKKLQAAETKLSTAQARLEAASTRLEFNLRGGGVSLAGLPITGEGTRTVSEATEIAIDGVGSIRVLPGAQDFSQLKAECHRAQEALDSVLQTAGVRSADDGRRGEADLADAESSAKHLEALIVGLAPNGVDALRSAATQATGEVSRHAQALAAMPAGQEHALSVAAAEAQEQFTQKTLKAAQTDHERARDAASKAQEQLRIAARELDAARAKLQAAGREERRRDIGNELLAARAEQQGKLEALGKLDAELKAAQPEQLRLDVERLTKSATALESAHGRIGAELHQLSGQLQAKGVLGLQEEAAALQMDVARLDRQVEEKTRRAAALTYLRKVLTEKRAEVARSIRAPLQVHMNHYLDIQFPGTTIELDEGLRPARITRPGRFGTESGAFEELSGGEREQLGIIARLAYADLLKQAGKPTLVMLDDSLVNSDQGKLAQMKRVLYDAAQRHQILIFTCHQENWLDIGVAPRTLQ
jgi:hypothetical protein